MKFNIRNIEEKELPHFYEKSNRASFFCSETWISSIKKTECLYGLFAEDGQLRGGFVAEVMSLKGIKTLAPPSLTPHCGLFFDELASNNSKRSGLSKDVLKALVDFLASHPAKIISLPFPPEIIDMQPMHWAGLRVSPKYTFRIDLNRTLDEIRSNYSPKLRNAIKKAKELGVNINASAGKNEIVSSIESRWNEKGLSINIETLKNVVHGFDTQKSVIAQAVLNGEVKATAVCVHDEVICYYLAGAYDAQAGMNGAGPMLIDFAIETSKARGLRHFDFEGSMIPEVEKYFRSFGGEITPYFLVEKAPWWVSFAKKIFGK